MTRDVNGAKEKYILKKIECGDENFANQAYRELLYQKRELEEISGTIPAKEFRVYWESKNSSIHIFCLREVYKENLIAELQKSFLSYSVVREKFVENYMCQLLLILEQCHKRNIFHRAIKLSNIVKNQELKSLFLVDFAIEGTTQFNNLEVYSSAWQPPEFGEEQQHPLDNEKIDIWGVGAVMLCVLSSIFVEPGEKFEELLWDIKKDPKTLDEICEQLLERYSKEIITIIQSMLDSDPFKRPTIMNIKKESHLETAFQLNEADEISKGFRKSKIKSFWNLTKGESTESVLSFLSTFIDCEERVTSALIFLNKTFVCQNSLDLKTEGKELVLTAMKNHIQIEKVQFSGFQLLVKLASKSSSEDYIFSCQAVRTVIAILKGIPKTPLLKPILYEFLSILALSELGAYSFGSHGGLQILSAMLKEDINDPFLLQKSCNALWGLCTQECNARIAAYEGIPADMCSCLKKYFQNLEVAKELITVLFSLSTVPNVVQFYCKHNVIYLIINFLKKNISKSEIIALCCNTLKSFLLHATFYDNIITQFRKNNLLPLLVSILWNNLQDPDIIYNCLTTLTSIIFDDEESAYSFLISKNKDVKKQSGMYLLRKIINANKNNVKVAENVCRFLEVLIKFDEGRLHSKTHNISSWISGFKSSFNSDKELCDLCNNIEKRLRTIRDDL